MEKTKTKILLVDDDDLIRMYFRDIFWVHGLESQYEILIADGPEQARDLIKNKKTRPNLIFLDLVMPRSKGGVESTWKTGLELLKFVKTTPDFKDIKAVIYSGINDSFVRKEAEALGATTYLLKGENLPKDIIELTKKLMKK